MTAGRAASSPARPRIVPLGDESLVVEVGDQPDAAVNEAVCALAERIVAAAVAGVRDVVPSFAAVGVHYDAEAVERGARETPYAAMRRHLEPLLDAGAMRPQRGRTVEVPTCYGGEHGPDLDDTAAACGLTPAELVAAHAAAEGLRVYMIGFAPGAPYLGMLDPRLDVPRLRNPRTGVPAGSVAIANRQSVIYPVQQPGGWRLIGRTPLTLFDARKAEPCLLRPGDRVVFKPIDADAYRRLAAAPA